VVFCSFLLGSFDLLVELPEEEIFVRVVLTLDVVLQLLLKGCCLPQSFESGQ